MHTTLLTRDDLRRIVCRIGIDALMDETIGRLAAAFAAFDPKDTVIPARDGFKYSHPQIGLVEWMPALRVGRWVHLKVVGYHPRSGALHGLPTIVSSLSLYSVDTGRLVAVMDGAFVTALRTGAASAVASRVLAAPASRVLGIIGCGAQAVTQLHALARCFALDTVFIHDTDPQALASFPARVAALHGPRLKIRAAAPEAFLPELDILCTATSVAIGEGPVFADGPLQAHLHVNAVGSDFPGKTELPPGLVQRSLVCPDFVEQALKEGECQLLAPEDVGPDLHALVRDQARLAGERGRCTVFDSTGWALEDMVTMELLMEHAHRLGIGQAIELESFSSDCRDPYRFLSESEDTAATDAAPGMRRTA